MTLEEELAVAKDQLQTAADRHWRDVQEIFRLTECDLPYVDVAVDNESFEPFIVRWYGPYGEQILEDLQRDLAENHPFDDLEAGTYRSGSWRAAGYSASGPGGRAVKPADIRKGRSYTNGAGDYRKVVVFSPANPSKRGRAVDMVGWKTSGDGAIQWSGLAGFVGWAERECGGTPVELGEESPRTGAKAGQNRPRRPGRRRKPRGLASAIRYWLRTREGPRRPLGLAPPGDGRLPGALAAKLDLKRIFGSQRQIAIKASQFLAGCAKISLNDTNPSSTKSISMNGLNPWTPRYFSRSPPHSTESQAP